jgi:hypothetical protein
MGEELFVPGEDGRVYPMGRGGANGAGSPSMVLYADNRGADPAAIMRFETSLRRLSSQFGAQQRALRYAAEGR